MNEEKGRLNFGASLIKEAFSGRELEDVLSEAQEMEKEILKPWYVPYENLMALVKQEGIHVNKRECSGHERKSLFNELLNSTKSSLVIGTGTLNCDIYCEKNMLELAAKKIKEINLTIYLGGTMMTENSGKNLFWDEVLLPNSKLSNVEIWWFPYRLAFHSYIRDEFHVLFQDFHYEFNTQRYQYSIESNKVALNLKEYYAKLAKAHKAIKISRENSDIIPKAGRIFFFDFKLFRESGMGKILV